MAKQYASFTGKSVVKIKKDMQRDFWMDAQEALDYGLVDQII
jgi:ATP-dependent Clp protease protease subunit